MKRIFFSGFILTQNCSSFEFYPFVFLFLLSFHFIHPAPYLFHWKMEDKGRVYLKVKSPGPLHTHFSSLSYSYPTGKSCKTSNVKNKYPPLILFLNLSSHIPPPWKKRLKGGNPTPQEINKPKWKTFFCVCALLQKILWENLKIWTISK